jgi:ABC-type branched-subunit amino acid transport system substrate-binding protein
LFLHLSFVLHYTWQLRFNLGSLAAGLEFAMPFAARFASLWSFALLSLVSAGAALADPGVDATHVLLGQSAPFTGPAAQLGVQYNLGAQVYFDALNAAGGVHGRKIQLITADDRYEADAAAANTTKLLDEDKVFALFGYVGTPTSVAATPIFTREKVPFFAPFTGAEVLRNPVNHYVFNIRASYFDETEHLIDQLTNLSINNIAVFYQDDAYGQAGLAGVKRALDKRNLKIAALATVQRNSVDVSKAADVLLQAQPQAIVEISAYQSCAALIRTMKAKGYAGQFLNVSFVGSQALADVLGADGVGVQISQVVPFPYKGKEPVVREYLKAMQAAGDGAKVDYTSLEGYIAAKVFAEGLRRAGPNLSREGLISALETINPSSYDVGGFDVDFSAKSHSGSKFVDETMILPDRKFRN